MCVYVCVADQSSVAQQRRAPKPTFDPVVVSDVFFPSLESAFEGPPPSVAALRQRAAEIQVAAGRDDKAIDTGGWPKLVSAETLEAEVKNLRLHYDSIIGTPGDFKSGGYQKVRVDLSALATLFGVINEYPTDVRFKKDAPAARDLIAAAAANSSSGTTQAYNEVKLRQADLGDLVSGTGITVVKKPDDANDWSMIADRTPLMEYTERVIERLEENAFDAEAVEQEADAVRRDAELLAMLGEVITREGMDDADDEAYCDFSRAMSEVAGRVVSAMRASDYEAAVEASESIRESCDNCHADYRIN